MIDQVDEIKSKIDIIEVISSYIPLKKMGRNLGGLCPFHGEKTPSFMVSPERQSFKCFGCSEGGDVFTFLEKIEGWDFRETLEELAKRAGVKLTDQKISRGSKVREKLIDINNLVSKFYSHILDNHPSGKIARDYLANRGVDETLWKKFGLGYSPDGWENTYNFLKKRGFGEPDIALSGLVVGRERNAGKNSFYDRFRGRIMFPIKDSRGTILGFSGRVLKDAKEAKYINSPETPIFNKGSLLFGLDLARTAIRDKNETVLVEGEFDVISAHKAGVTNTVASKGTALTEKQVATIARLCENVALCFDMDLAGDAASRRGVELLDMAGLTIKVVRLKGGKDPDELAQKDPKEFERAITQAVNVYDYLIDSACERYDAKTADGKKKIGREVLPVIAKVTDDLVRGHYETKLAKILGLDVTLISQAVARKEGNVVGARESSLEVVTVDSGNHVLDDYFLALFLAGNEVLSKVISKLNVDDFENDDARGFWKAVRDIISDSKPVKTADLLSLLPKEFAKFVDRLYFINISPSVLEKDRWVEEILKVADRIKKKSLSRKMRGISEELKVAQEDKDEAKLKLLSKKFDTISRQLEEKNTESGEEKFST